MRTISVGVIGFGTVGTGVIKILKKNAPQISRRIGAQIRVTRIADLDITSQRAVRVAPSVLTTRSSDITHDPEIDIVVELIGGLSPAYDLIMDALKQDKHVVTANKALLSAKGHAIFQAAGRRRSDVAFEASVGGGIPIIRCLQESLVADSITGFFGILNGTANYILTRMTNAGEGFDTVLHDAQRLGYAEADPTFDVDGIDTMHKLSVLVSLAFGRRVNARAIYTEGIRSISPLDIEFVRQLGYRIKLLAICRHTDAGIEARVHPTLVPADHLLAQVHGSLNALFISSRDLGPTMLYGHGAGMMPTASAVVADIISIARNIVSGSTGRVAFYPHEHERGVLPLVPIRSLRSRYYLRFSAADKPGVLSKIAGILGRHNISIESVVQHGRQARGGGVPIFMLLHEADEADLLQAVRQLDRLAFMQQKTKFIRIADDLLTAGT